MCSRQNYTPHNIFEEIDRLHSEWKSMDKALRLSWLATEKMRLNGLVNQLAQQVYVRGGFSGDYERAYASKLFEMTQTIDSEGARVANEMANDVLKEIMKGLMKKS